MYQQIEADLDEFKTVNQREFLTWFENLQNVLSGDVDAKLLLMINKIKEDIGSLENLETDSKASIVDAINELKIRMDNSKVDTVTTMEQAAACTDPEKPVGVGAFKEMTDSLLYLIPYTINDRVLLKLPSTPTLPLIVLLFTYLNLPKRNPLASI